MKKIVCLLFIAGFLSVSCSGSDDSNDSGNDTKSNYLPMDSGDYWVYDTKSSASAGRDSLYIANDTVIGKNTYKKFKTKSAPTGFYSGALSNNAIRKTDGKLLLTGSTAFAFSSDIPIAIAVNDFVFFDTNATAGTALGATSGTIGQPVDAYTANINYKLSAVAGDDIANYTSNGVVYPAVKTVKLTLTLSITAKAVILGTTLEATVMKTQDVLVSTQYYVKNIGAVAVSTAINYHLEDLSKLGVTLPIDSYGSDHQDETLVSYHVKAE